MKRPPRPLVNYRVTIMGLGSSPSGSGVSAAAYFAQRGADVLVTDLRTRAQLRRGLQALQTYPGIQYVLGRHRPRDFTSCDLVVHNPAVPRHSPFLALARERAIPVETDVSLFFLLTNRPVIGITGTRGKSTTTVLLYDMIKRKQRDTLLGGNIRQSPLTTPRRIRGTAPAVLELSSWMLESIQHHRVSPTISVFTNFFDDHLDRYPSRHAYLRSKYPLFLYQRSEDELILNHDSAPVRALATHARGRVRWFSSKPLHQEGSVSIQKGQLVNIRSRRVKNIFPVADLRLRGRHNQENALAATSAALSWGVSLRDIRASLKSFAGLADRMEVVADIDQVEYINDTTATNPVATAAAMDALHDQPVVLIAGGNDKNLSYTDLAKNLTRSSITHLFLLPGTASTKLRRALPRARKFPVRAVPSIAVAVRRAQQLAQKGGSVVLSPGASSFSQYANEFERGEAFREAVRSLEHPTRP